MTSKETHSSQEALLGSLNSRLVIASSAVEHSGSENGTPELTSTKIEVQEEFEPPPAEPSSGGLLPFRS